MLRKVLKNYCKSNNRYFNVILFYIYIYIGETWNELSYNGRDRNVLKKALGLNAYMMREKEEGRKSLR